MNSEVMIFDIVDQNCVVYNISLSHNLDLVILYPVFYRNDLESQGLGWLGQLIPFSGLKVGGSSQLANEEEAWLTWLCSQKTISRKLTNQEMSKILEHYHECVVVRVEKKSIENGA